MSAQGAHASCPLSPRQCQLLLLMMRGYSLKAAARQIGITPNTARAYIRGIYDRFDARSVPHAVALCLSSPNRPSNCPLARTPYQF